MGPTLLASLQLHMPQVRATGRGVEVHADWMVLLLVT